LDVTIAGGGEVLSTLPEAFAKQTAELDAVVQGNMP
jgi:hypothetical protein